MATPNLISNKIVLRAMECTARKVRADIYQAIDAGKAPIGLAYSDYLCDVAEHMDALGRPSRLAGFGATLPQDPGKRYAL